VRRFVIDASAAVEYLLRTPPLLTTDGPLSRAPALGIEIHNLRIE
jgi:hypothetical protein